MMYPVTAACVQGHPRLLLTLLTRTLFTFRAEREGKNEILISRLLFTQELVSRADDYLLSVVVYHFLTVSFFERICQEIRYREPFL